MSNGNSALYVVATPIGNLGDISPRALETLRSVNVIAAEDTRYSGRLLQHFGITTPCVALHEHNEREVCDSLIARLQRGDNVALISDAGTPLLNDPGYHLVSTAHEHHIKVIPVPGPSSLVSALSASGLAADRFVFEGFLPAKSAARRARIKQLKDEPRTVVMFEAPHRISACLSDLDDIIGSDRVAVVARELTKAFETIRRDRLGVLADWVCADPNQQKGEFVIVLQGAPRTMAGDKDGGAARVLEVLLEDLPLKQAVTLAVKITGLGKNLLYDMAVKRQQRQERE